MLKKILLITLLSVSTLATAHITLNLDITITHQAAEHHEVKTITVSENVIEQVTFDDIDNLVISVLAETDGQNVTIQTQFLQKTDSDDLIFITKEPLAIEVPVNQPGTITVYESDNSGSLVLIVTPTIIE